MSSSNKKHTFYTLGCRANQYQTEVIKNQLTTNNSQLTTFSNAADVYVINTCMVTEDAERKSRQAIRRAFRQNPKAKIIITGCWARLESEKIEKLFPEAEIKPPQSLLPTAYSILPRVRSNLMIQDGCEHFCSYCIVPYARGKFSSKPQEQVIEEARHLIDAGAREIVLTGINLGAYGDLCSVLRALCSIPKLLRLRLSSIEPMYLTKELIDAVASTPKVCHHLHIPLQSGDNSILAAMNRKYSREDFLELIHYARAKMPECGLTTDIIVGFPGEGEKEFQNTVNLVNQIKFSRLHVFSYSQRKGTSAATMSNQINTATKKKRNKIMRDLGQKLMVDFAKNYLNTEVSILVEQKGEGLTSNFIRCFFNNPHDSSGSLRKTFARFVNNSGEIREVR
ncbi:MiaB/RimO family radical SAM methylthiotransferase [Candidatus Margulisiibacteriota bacterium]